MERRLAAIMATDVVGFAGLVAEDEFGTLERVVHLRQDVIDGDIHPDHDLEALHATLTALFRGYRIFRIPLAKRMGIGTRELDARVTGVVRTWLEAMARPPAPN